MSGKTGASNVAARFLPPDNALATACVLVVCMVYLSTLAVNHSEAEDALYYAVDITRGSPTDVFHPNHLRFASLNRLIFTVASMLGYGGPTMPVMQLVNTLASMVTLSVFYRILTLLRLPCLIKVVALLMLAFSYGYWWYSVEGETYILPLPFVMLSVHRLVRILVSSRTSSHIMASSDVHTRERCCCINSMCCSAL
ncbi:MAG: hypothetical protein C4326_06370 [Ignavibacteria bacterium]